MGRFRSFTYLSCFANASTQDFVATKFKTFWGPFHCKKQVKIPATEEEEKYKDC